MRRLLDVEISVPSLTEQRRMVEFLASHLSRLQFAVNELVLAKARLNALAMAAIHRILRGDGELLSAGRVMHFGAERLVIPDSWQISSVGETAELVEYGTSAKAHVDEFPDDLPVLRMGNLQAGQLVWDSLKYLPASSPEVGRLRLQSGDLLFNRTNSPELVGKSAVYEGGRPATFASYLLRVRFRPTVNPHWASRVINSLLGRQFIGSVVSQQVGQANVNGTKLRAFPLPVPPRAEQDAFVARLSALDEDAARLGSDLAVATTRGRLLQRSLLGAAFAGRLNHPTVVELAEEFACV